MEKQTFRMLNGCPIKTRAQIGAGGRDRIESLFFGLPIAIEHSDIAKLSEEGICKETIAK